MLPKILLVYLRYGKYLNQDLVVILMILEDRMNILYFIDKHTWVTSILAMIVPVWIAAHQIGRQLESTIASQRESKLDELHLKIYSEIADSIKEYGYASSKLSSFVLMLPSNLENNILFNQDIEKIGILQLKRCIKERSSELIELWAATSKCYVSILAVIDKYELAFSDFGNMRLAIDKSQDNARDKYLKFFNLVEKYLPFDVDLIDQEKLGLKVYPCQTPDKNTLEEIKSLSKLTYDAILDSDCYLHDLRIEAQNALLSPIFKGKKALRRKEPGSGDDYTVLKIDS